MKKIFKITFGVALVFALATSFTLQTNQINQSTIGPENGYLVISGGGMDEPTIKKFIALTKKTEPKILVIPTADVNAGINKKTYARYQSIFEKAGAKSVSFMHTRDSAEANTQEFLNMIREADGVWFTGGRQWRLADSYLNTRVHKELFVLLERGGVIGGNSAGASIQASFMVRGDSKSNLIMEGDHVVGLGFLKNSAIDQHILQRNRHFDLLEIHHKYPELLCLGIDGGTSVIVHGNTMEVIGEHYVSMFDGSFWHRQTNEIKHLELLSERFYFLKAGDKYDLAKRKVIN